VEIPKLRARFASALSITVLLAGCATAPRWPAGGSLLQGVTPTFPSPPDSLRASLELTAQAGGRKSSVTAAFSAKPGAAYKLDLFGIPGVTAGGFLWRRGSLGEPDKWDLVIYDKEEYVEGQGPRVEIGPPGLGQIPVHDVFAWLWGDFFPGDTALAGLPMGWHRAPAGGFAYAGTDGEWRVRLDSATGLPRSVSRADSAFRIEYADWRAGAGKAAPERPVPQDVRLFRFGEPLLEIKVGSVEDQPHWKRDPFVLRIPKGFVRVERVRD
jgi:hypothetical protein